MIESVNLLQCVWTRYTEHKQMYENAHTIIKQQAWFEFQRAYQPIKLRIKRLTTLNFFFDETQTEIHHSGVMYDWHATFPILSQALYLLSGDDRFKYSTQRVHLRHLHELTLLHPNQLATRLDAVQDLIQLVKQESAYFNKQDMFCVIPAYQSITPSTFSISGIESQPVYRFRGERVLCNMIMTWLQYCLRVLEHRDELLALYDHGERLRYSVLLGSMYQTINIALRRYPQPQRHGQHSSSSQNQREMTLSILIRLRSDKNSTSASCLNDAVLPLIGLRLICDYLFETHCQKTWCNTICLDLVEHPISNPFHTHPIVYYS